MAPSLPHLWLFTDERIDTDAMLRAVSRLPRGSGIIFRHYSLGTRDRHALFQSVRKVARRRGLVLLIGGSWRLAAQWRADGWHGPGARKYPGLRSLIHSAPVHNTKELAEARRTKADCIFISPVFPTRSHEGAAAIGPLQFSRIARMTDAPAFALGGMNARRTRRLKALGAAGWAAIDALSQPKA